MSTELRAPCEAAEATELTSTADDDTAAVVPTTTHGPCPSVVQQEPQACEASTAEEHGADAPGICPGPSPQGMREKPTGLLAALQRQQQPVQLPSMQRGRKRGGTGGGKRDGAVAFVSTGLHHLGCVQEAEPLTVPPARRPQSPSCERGHAGAQAEGRVWVNNGIGADNRGFKLLKKAGWREGSGIGRNEQGRREPVQAWMPKGRLGLGAAAGSGARRRGGAPPKQAAGGPAPSAGAAAAAAGTACQMSTGPAALSQSTPSARERVRRLLQEELGREDMQTKIQFHQQVMKHEDEQRRERAIRQYIYRSFNEPSSTATADTNPLLRSGDRLRSRNPLLDSDDDQNG